MVESFYIKHNSGVICGYIINSYIGAIDEATIQKNIDDLLI